MTTKSKRSNPSRSSNERSTQKIRLRKETLRDLALGSRHGRGVKGGAYSTDCGGGGATVMSKTC